MTAAPRSNCGDERWFAWLLDPNRQTQGDVTSMAMVVTQRCWGCKDTACVVVCPAQCFYEGEHMLYIHPDECINCGLCAPECPQQAIFYEDDVPEEYRSDIALNRDMSRCSSSITQRRRNQTPVAPAG